MRRLVLAVVILSRSREYVKISLIKRVEAKNLEMMNKSLVLMALATSSKINF